MFEYIQIIQHLYFLIFPNEFTTGPRIPWFIIWAPRKWAPQNNEKMFISAVLWSNDVADWPHHHVWGYYGILGGGQTSVSSLIKYPTQTKYKISRNIKISKRASEKIFTEPPFCWYKFDCHQKMINWFNRFITKGSLRMALQ